MPWRWRTTHSAEKKKAVVLKKTWYHARRESFRGKGERGRKVSAKRRNYSFQLVADKMKKTGAE